MINFCVTQMSREFFKKMKKFFSISETAKMVNTTTETLRHYDRIDLVKPCKVDEWTGYMNTIKALRCMDLSLQEIKKILSYDDFDQVIGALKRAEESADEKIAELNNAKAKIQRALHYYEGKLNDGRSEREPFIKHFPERVILLSDTMNTPTTDNLWDYHRHFYGQLPKEMKGDFSFEDIAGIYEQGGRRQMFAVCTRYRQTDGIKILPQGNYLCADCTEESRGETTRNLIDMAKTQYGADPQFTVQLVVVTGILRWNYQAQVFISA